MAEGVTVFRGKGGKEVGFAGKDAKDDAKFTDISAKVSEEDDALDFDKYLIKTYPKDLTKRRSFADPYPSKMPKTHKLYPDVEAWRASKKPAAPKVVPPPVPADLQPKK